MATNEMLKLTGVIAMLRLMTELAVVHAEIACLRLLYNEVCSSFDSR